MDSETKQVPERAALLERIHDALSAAPGWEAAEAKQALDQLLGLAALPAQAEPESEHGMDRKEWIAAAQRVYMACGDDEKLARELAVYQWGEQDMADLEDPYEAALADTEGRPATPSASHPAPAEPDEQEHPTNIDSPFNACMYREHCKGLAAKLASVSHQSHGDHIITQQMIDAGLDAMDSSEAPEVEVVNIFRAMSAAASVSHPDQCRQALEFARSGYMAMRASGLRCLPDFTERSLSIIDAALSTTPQPAAPEEPTAWVRFCSDGGYEGPIMHAAMDEVRKRSGAWTPLYAAMVVAASLAEAGKPVAQDTKGDEHHD